MPENRFLTEHEIAVLESRGCRAEVWCTVRVAKAFRVGNSFHRVSFAGNVTLGKNCAVNDATLSNVDIGNGVLLDRVSFIAHDGESSFGNGARANVLAEDGARSVPVWRGMSSQLAHVLCHLKGHPAADALEAVIARDVAESVRARSFIGDGCRLRRVGLLRNVWIGAGAALEGVSRLVDCHVEGGAAPAYVGDGVSAESCVFQSASRVAGGTRLENCLVGEGTVLDKAFYGEHSMFFANGDFRLGEALSILAGPCSVSHHRATLILACQCLLCNIGSAFNSSNHHYKLGARHGGVMRRGARCGSGAYVFWPGDIGAFTTVVGRHAAEHLATSLFPFSLLVAKGDASVLVPGVNLFGAGCFRDELKWRERDRRDGVPRPLDMVNPSVLSPYVMQSMEEGASLLRRSQDMEADLRHGGAVIPARRIAPALRLYEAAWTYYVGLSLLRFAEEKNADVSRVIRELTASGTAYSRGRWRDWGGMLVSGADAGEFLADAAEGRLDSAEAIRTRFEAIHAAYPEREAEWAAWQWRGKHGDPTPESVAAFYEEWRKAVHLRCESMERDIAKEFTPEAMYGFGVEDDAAESFARVRGSADDEPMCARIHEDRDRLLRMADAVKCST